MKSSPTIPAVLLMALLSSACEMLAGIGDRKVSSAGASGYDAGFNVEGGALGQGGVLGGAWGADAAGGTWSSPGSGGSRRASSAVGGAGGAGGVTSRGGSAGSGGIGPGVIIGSGGARPDARIETDVFLARDVASDPPTCPPAGLPGTGVGLTGDYYDNQDLTAFRATRTDAKISFVWSDGTSPMASVAPGTYSVRWTGQVLATYTGWTTFYVVHDDGALLFIDDKLVIDDWNSHGRTEREATLPTVAGQKYNLRLEYFEKAGGGQIGLLWGSICQAKQTIPTTQLFPSHVTPDAGVPPVDASDSSPQTVDSPMDSVDSAEPVVDAAAVEVAGSEASSLDGF